MTREGPEGCPVCRNPERRFIDALLGQGLSPRALCKRIGGTTRRQLARHRDKCLTEQKGERA